MLFREHIHLENAQALFDVKPWTQFFDLGSHEPPISEVRNITLRGITGSVRSLGELRGNKGDLISEITLEVHRTSRRRKSSLTPRCGRRLSS